MSRVPDGFVRTHPEIADAIASGRPVVGLETAVLTHGLSRSGRTAPNCLRPDGEVAGMLGGEIDWDEFMRVIAGNGPCNRERLAARKKAHADGAWVREAALAYSRKRADRREAARHAAE